MLECTGSGLNLWSSKGECSLRQFLEFSGIKPRLKIATEYLNNLNTKKYRDLRPTNNFVFYHSEVPDQKTLNRHIKFFLGNRFNKKLRLELTSLGISFLFLDHREGKPPRIKVYPEELINGRWSIVLSIKPSSSYLLPFNATGFSLSEDDFFDLRITIKRNSKLLELASDATLFRSSRS